MCCGIERGHDALDLVVDSMRHPRYAVDRKARVEDVKCDLPEEVSNRPSFASSLSSTNRNLHRLGSAASITSAIPSNRGRSFSSSGARMARISAFLALLCSAHDDLVNEITLGDFGAKIEEKLGCRSQSEP
jgi:hypothetical protein